MTKIITTKTTVARGIRTTVVAHQELNGIVSCGTPARVDATGEIGTVVAHRPGGLHVITVTNRDGSTRTECLRRSEFTAAKSTTFSGAAVPRRNAGCCYACESTATILGSTRARPCASCVCAAM